MRCKGSGAEMRCPGDECEQSDPRAEGSSRQPDKLSRDGMRVLLMVIWRPLSQSSDRSLAGSEAKAKRHHLALTIHMCIVITVAADFR